MRGLIILLGLVFCLNGFSEAEERNWLTEMASQPEFEEWIVPDNSWIRFPEYKDRAAWDKIPSGIKNSLISQAEEYLSFPWPAITATSYLEYARSGDRSAMESIYSKRKMVLESLVIAELLEGEGRFLDQIINGVWVFLEQTWWGFSAHLDFQEAGPGLPDHNDMTIDLGVGFIAADIAWTYHFFKDEFDKVNPLINQRIVKEISEKVLTPYYTRRGFFWQGYRKENVNNWNPWCNYNVLNCILLVEPDRIKKIRGIQKVMKSLDAFINHYNDDGGCDEGPGYWSHAGGKLFEALDVLYRASDGKLNLFGKPLIKNMGEYFCMAHIAGNYFINFADAAPQITARPGVVYRFGKGVNSRQMMEFGACLAKELGWENSNFKVKTSSKLELNLANLFDRDEILKNENSEPLMQEFWLDQTQIAGAREAQGSVKGFYFAAKGGHNAESHNHNDVGNFILYFNGKPIIADAGVGTYTSKTFSDRRYEIWTMQSQFHNLPTINGVGQKDGAEFKSKNCSFTSQGKSAVFSVDIANAYPPGAEVKKWVRTYTLNRGNSFKIENSFQLLSIKKVSSQSYITPCIVDRCKEGLRITGEDAKLMMKFDKDNYNVEIEDVKLDDKKLKKNWPGGLRRIKLTYKNQELSGSDKIMIEKL